MLSDPCPSLSNKASVWWKDICVVGASTNHVNWFIDYIACKLGNGGFIDFWHDRWLRAVPLYRMFGSLFQVADPDMSYMAHNNFWTFEDWSWNVALQVNPLQ